jgi:hypothetical protein
LFYAVSPYQEVPRQRKREMERLRRHMRKAMISRKEECLKYSIDIGIVTWAAFSATGSHMVDVKGEIEVRQYK